MKTIILLLSLLFSLVFSFPVAAQEAGYKAPFEGMDLTWINGQNRQKNFPLTLKDSEGETILTGVAYLDTYFNYDLHNPVDNTHTISSTIGRHKEFTVNLASIGVETYYKNIIGRLWLQFGQMGSIVQDLDGTVNRGRNTALSNMRYFREVSAGYHFNKWSGINLEVGLFMSYIGLESYVTQENWSYQRSMVCDFTPFYFTGARLQMFPSSNFKTELWLLNGWQTYDSWNDMLGVGNSNYYRPNENLQFVANFYLGKDTRGLSTLRFHHDNSVVARYSNNPNSSGISQAAFSINNHIGFQSGAGASFETQNMMGTAIANRIWFNKNMFALTLRADFVTNPGLYLAFSPSPVAPNAFTEAIANEKNQRLSIWQGTATFDIMPNDYSTFRFEYANRQANVPYFAGRNGTTSPDGWIGAPIGDWMPDLRKNENRFTLAVNFRL